MREFLHFLAALFYVGLAFGQEVGQKYDPVTGLSTYFDVSRPLTEIGAIPPKGALGHHLHKQTKEIPNLFEDAVFKNTENALPKGFDPVWQQTGGTKGMSNPLVNFEGTRNDDNAGFVAPPDTDGDVGPNHYFQMCNVVFEIFDKQGNSLFGPADNSTIWDGFVGDWTGTNDGDPIILYDQQANRWLVSQFAVNTSVTGGTYWILVAISTTGDPTGSYYRYAFQFANYPDYPKFGIWRDGYYLMVQHGNGNVTAAALNRSQMIAGTSPAQMVQFNVPSLPGSGFIGMLPSDNDGTWAPAGSPNYFAYFSDDAWGSDPVDRLKIWEFHANWASPASSTLTFTTNLNTAAFSSAFGTHNQGIIPQQGTGQGLAVAEKALMNRMQYRNFGTYESMVCCHTVDVDGANRAGTRWYELRKTTGAWYIYQQGTYSPGATDNFWMASIAQNGDGDIALGFSVSSSTRYPSIHYTGRNPNDPLGQMTMGEKVIIEGAHYQGGARWGDYTMMSVDPSNDETFWYTNEYLGVMPGTWAPWITQIASFNLGDNCAASGGCDEYISNVNFGSINNSSACTNYGDYTNLVNDIPINAIEPITVTNGHSYASDQCGIWVDWNHDGDFGDANETISVSGTPGNGPYTANIAVPAGQSYGLCTVRVRITYTGAVDPCGTTQYGEVEDYKLYVSSPATNVWTGAASNNWHNSANWSLNHVPYTTDNVSIPAGVPNTCWVYSINAACNNLTIASGTYLRNYDVTLTVNGNLDVNGQLMMDNSTATAITQVNGNINWNSGSTAWTADATIIKVAGDWNFNAGAGANLGGGVMFFGNANSFVRSYDPDCSFWRFGNYKPAGYFVSVSNISTAALTINDSFYNQTDAATYFHSPYQVIIRGEFYNNGHLYCGDGTTVFDGTTHGVEMNAGDYFNNLTVSSSGNVTLNTNTDINGNVLIESGILSAGSYTLNVGGNWTNSVGLAAFNEGTSRVIFDGPGHQYIYSSETFNILEAKMGAALRVNNAAYTVTCNQYDWTSGGVDVIAGTFTALNLYDNGIWGGFWLNPGGTINLTSSGWIDLNANMNIYGGTFNVIGGTVNSDWPYSANASITMSGGVLDFKNRGINIAVSAPYTLTENITGGTIRTAGSFTGSRTDFTPTGGTIELYGSTDATLSHGVGSNFVNLLINKSAVLDGSGPKEDDIVYDREGNGTKNTLANGVSAISNLVLLGNLNIQAGILAAPSSLKLAGNWTNSVGTAGFTEGTGTVTFNGGGHQYCYGETFYGLELNKSFLDLHFPAGTSTTCQIYDWNAGELEVEGGTFIANDLFDNGIYGYYYITSAGGLLELHQDAAQFIDLNGRFVIDGGTMNIYGGNIYSYWAWDGNAALWMTAGVLDFKDNGVYLPNTAYTLTEQITGGTIRVNKGFYGNRTDFNPAGGTIELYGSSDVSLGHGAGSSFNNVLINKAAKSPEDSGEEETSEILTPAGREPIHEPGTRSNTVLASSNITINGSLNIQSGTFDLNGHIVNVLSNVDINSATLKMTNALDKLTTSTLNWNLGSNDNINNGEIDVSYWNFKEGTNAALSAPNLAVVTSGIEPYDADAEFGNFKAAPFSKNTQNTDATYPVRISGNCTFAAGATWQTMVDWIIAGNLTIENTASFLVQNASDLLVNGSFTHAGSLTLSSSTTALIHGDYTFANTGALNVLGGTFTNDYSTGLTILEGTLQFTGGSFEFPNRSVSLAGTFNDQITGGTFRFGRTFAAGSAGVFQPTGGLVEFINASSGNYIQVVGDNFLYDVILNKPGSSLQVYDNLTIKGDLTINAGVLNSNNRTIAIAGDWTNNAGVAGFDETTGRVIFNGSDVQFCNTENFNILEINKPSNLLYNTSVSVINCQVYDWTNGGIWISPGNFSAADLADNGLFGTFAIFNGTMDLHQDNIQFVDINGNITVGSGGNLNVYGGNGDSYWPFNGNANVTISGGVLDFKNVGINIYNSGSYALTENITGGVIKTTGNFAANNAVFTPTGGILELYGDISSNIYMTAGSNLFGLAIFKTGLAKDNEPVVYSDHNGKIITLTRGNQVTLASDVLVNGALSVWDGILSLGNSGFDLTSLGAASIENGGKLEILSGSQLKLNNSMTVKSGGTLTSTGIVGTEAVITRAAVDKYSFVVQSGGNIGASNTIFEYMGATGINIASGAVVDPAQAFNSCTFRQGLAGNTLFTMNSTQDLTCTGAIFPANVWGGASNVTKATNAGRITFKDFSGAFSGSAFENDIYNRVDWFVPQLSASPTTLNVNPPAGTTTFDITSNLAWTVSESTTWFSVNTASGSNNATITVTYDQNTSAVSRSGNITLSAAGVPNVTVTVIQAGATLSVLPASQNVTAPAGTTTFNVTSNTAWTVSEATTWFSVLPMSGSGNGTLTVTYDQNASLTARSGQITVSSTGLANVVVTVNQAGVTPTLTVTPSNRDVTPPAGTTTFGVTSNTGWTVSESATWLSVAPASGTGNGTITVTYDQNTTTAARSANIIVTATGGTPTQTVTVTQAGATLSVLPASQNVTAPAGTTTFGVTSNTIWTASESTAWFTIAPTGGTGNNTITVTYEQNSSVTARSGQITVSTTGLPNVVVTVNQAGAGATLSVLPANRDVTPPASTTTFMLTSNTGWTVSEAVSWLSVLPLSGSGNGTLTVTYNENAIGSPRVGNITVTATGGSPATTVTVTQTSYPTHSVALMDGWQGLSSYIMPAVTNIPTLFTPIAANFSILQNLTGVYYPAGSLNTIGPWASQSAYSIKMNAASTLPIIGPLETNKTFALGNGWNLMPVICNTNVTTSTLVSGLGANLNIVKEIAGSKVYWPAYGIYTLSQLTPGKAYYVRMTAAGSVTFPANVADNGFIPDEPIRELSTPWNEIHRTAGSHVFAIQALAVSDLSQDDIIGIFTPDGICAGNIQIGNTSENLAFYAFADDQLTTETDGFTEGQPMIFKLFRPSTGEEFNLEVTYNIATPNYDGLFASEGISAIKGLSILNTGLANDFAKGLYIYPNPTTDKVTIGGITGIEQILLMTTEGTVVLKVNPTTDGNQVLDLSALPAGIYQVQIRTSLGVVSNKIIKGL